MAFNIVLQTNNSETIRVDKTLTDIVTLTGNLRDECTISDPAILIAAEYDDIKHCNYCTVEAFGRSYFVNKIDIVRSGLCRLTCHCDVLSSFKTGLRANKGIVRRAESSSAYNLYLNDGSLVSYQDPYILTEPFPAGFDGACFILAVAGG